MTEPTLAQTAQDLRDEVAGLHDAMNVLVRRSRRLRRMVIVTVISLTLDAALTVATGVVVHSLQRQGDQIQAQQAQTTATRHKVLCPLYTLLITATADPSRRSQLAPDKRPAYDQAVMVIRQGADALNCASP